MVDSGENEQKRNKKRGKASNRAAFGSPLLFDVLILYFCVGVGNVRGKLSGGEGFAGGVLPGAGEIVIRVDEFEGGAGGQAGEGGAVIEYVAHIRHILCI